jgi:hypothetical protein
MPKPKVTIGVRYIFIGLPRPPPGDGVSMVRTLAPIPLTAHVRPGATSLSQTCFAAIAYGVYPPGMTLPSELEHDLVELHAIDEIFDLGRDASALFTLLFADREVARTWPPV